MKPNPEKCPLLINKGCRKKIKIANNIIGNSECVKVLGVMFDSKLNFEAHAGDICKKASNKIQAPATITSRMNFPKKNNSLCVFQIPI